MHEQSGNICLVEQHDKGQGTGFVEEAAVTLVYWPYASVVEEVP
jgi:hypothetical protein